MSKEGEELPKSIHYAKPSARIGRVRQSNIKTRAFTGKIDAYMKHLEDYKQYLAKLETTKQKWDPATIPERFRKSFKYTPPVHKHQGHSKEKWAPPKTFKSKFTLKQLPDIEPAGKL